jgi:hypothetical protein
MHIRIAANNNTGRGTQMKRIFSISIFITTVLFSVSLAHACAQSSEQVLKKIVRRSASDSNLMNQLGKKKVQDKLEKVVEKRLRTLALKAQNPAPKLQSWRAWAFGGAIALGVMAGKALLEEFLSRKAKKLFDAFEKNNNPENS